MRAGRFGLVFALMSSLILMCMSDARAQTSLQWAQVIEKRLASLEAENAALKSKIQELENRSLPKGIVGTNIKYSSEEINGLKGPHLIFEGLNVHIQSGTGETTDGGVPTGLGNLVIGYNEQRAVPVVGRGGSHNLVVGEYHEYSSYGGLAAGSFNTISGASASVSGGYNNKASGNYSSVSGGSGNTAGGNRSSVSGGSENRAIHSNASVSGGRDNAASGSYSSVSGGRNNEASGQYSSVSAGGHDGSTWGNTASGDFSSVSGGSSNVANGWGSSISGGDHNSTEGTNSSVSGGSENTAASLGSSISGGYGHNILIDGYYDWRAGGLWQDQ